MSTTEGITERLNEKQAIELRNEVAGGLRYAHAQASANTGELGQASKMEAWSARRAH